MSIIPFQASVWKPCYSSVHCKAREEINIHCAVSLRKNDQQCVCREGTGSLYRAGSRASSLLSANHNTVLSTLMYCVLCICVSEKSGKSTVMEMFTCLLDVSSPI